MTISLPEAEFDEQYEEALEEEPQSDPTDDLDKKFKLNCQLSQGWLRKIDLRDGIFLEIGQVQHREHIIIDCPDTEADDIRCRFLLSGNEQAKLVSASGETSWDWASGQYWLNGTGSRNCLIQNFDVKPFLEIEISIKKEVFYSFDASPQGQLPEHFQRFVRPVSQEIYRRIGNIQPMMATVLQQILHCPYQGMVKRAYLESKVIELMALVLDHEVTIQQGKLKRSTLKPEQLEQIHYAKEILLRDLSNPPTLEELAHQAGLNDFLLKRGFHQAFGTTVFGELRAYRLGLAKQLLAEQDMTVAEVANRVGYASMSYFSTAFKRKFGLAPKAYQKACR